MLPYSAAARIPWHIMTPESCVPTNHVVMVLSSPTTRHCSAVMCLGTALRGGFTVSYVSRLLMNNAAEEKKQGERRGSAWQSTSSCLG